MALYRSDQTQLTFGAEPVPGGYTDPLLTDPAVQTSNPFSTALYLNANAGDTSIVVDAVTNAEVGQFILIGTDNSALASGSKSLEIRRIENISGTTNATIYLDAPLAHFHKADQDVVEILAYPASGEYIRANSFLPGVYDTVNLPEPSSAINPSYFLGTEEKRAYTHAYRGAQSLEGSISSFAVLNGWPLRFPIGKVESYGTSDGGNNSTLDTNDGEGVFEAKKGEYYIKLAATPAPDEVFNLGDSGTGDREIRKIVARNGAYAQINYPLSFTHTNGGSAQRVAANATTSAAGKYTHEITETTELDTITWEATFADSSGTAANTLKRRYYGGMVGTSTLAAEEGGMLTMSWDSVPFMGMQHNIAEGHIGNTNLTAGVALPGHSLMHTDLQKAGVPSGSATGETYPTTEPYYFSQGTIKMFDVVIAKVRDFSLNINNNLESRYYIEQRGDNRRRGPSQIHEGRREYTMTCTLVPDAIDATKISAHTRNIFTEYLSQGDSSAFGTNSHMTGFSMELSFIRGKLADADDGNDTITITVPAADGQKPGALLSTAPMQIDGNNPLQVSAEILIRTLNITVVDNEPFYP